MRRFAFLAAMVWLCGCGSQGDHATKPTADGTTAAESLAHPVAEAPAGGGPAGGGPASTIQADLQNAEKLINKGRFGTAVETLSRVIGSHPETADAFLLRARVKAEMRQDADALADFSTALRLEPNNSAHYTARGRFMHSRGNTRAAIADFDEAVKRNPKDAQAYNHRGAAFVTTGALPRAFADFNKAIELDPKYVDAYSNRSFAFVKADRIKEALADLDRAIQLDWTSANAYNNRGLLYFQHQDYEKALADFNTAIKHDDGNPKFYVHRRQTLLKLERYAEAQADAARLSKFKELGELNAEVFRNPRSPKPYFARGVFFLAEGRFDEALANFNRVLELDPKNWRALSERARTWIRRREFQKAVDDCTAALTIEPRGEAYAVRGDAYRKLGELEKALADYEASQRCDAEVAETWQLHSQALRQAGHVQEADDAAKRADELKALVAPRKP